MKLIHNFGVDNYYLIKEGQRQAETWMFRKNLVDSYYGGKIAYKYLSSTQKILVTIENFAYTYFKNRQRLVVCHIFTDKNEFNEFEGFIEKMTGGKRKRQAARLDAYYGAIKHNLFEIS